MTTAKLPPTTARRKAAVTVYSIGLGKRQLSRVKRDNRRPAQPAPGYRHNEIDSILTEMRGLAPILRSRCHGPAVEPSSGRTSAATMRANQVRLRFASMACVLSGRALSGARGLVGLNSAAHDLAASMHEVVGFCTCVEWASGSNPIGWVGVHLLAVQRAQN
jgi:hypothetical protein